MLFISLVYLIFVYSLPTCMDFCKQISPIGNAANAIGVATNQICLNPLTDRFHVVLHGEIHELVLSLSLHHT